VLCNTHLSVEYSFTNVIDMCQLHLQARSAIGIRSDISQWTTRHRNNGSDQR